VLGCPAPPGSQRVIIGGKYGCDVIPLHSTVSQIACKTTAALEGSWQLYGWGDGWTDSMDVIVIVDGRVSKCVTSDAHGCTFSYRNRGHWDYYYTPTLSDLQPTAVSTGTLITVTGRWRWEPFDFDEVKAPSQEVPLISVKVANRGTEFSRPKNEPFGQSGTRCALFDPATEEPFGVFKQNPDNENSRVERFICQVNGPREGGRYNLSVALLGTAMIPDSKMHMGESFVFRKRIQVDHEGEAYMLQHVPTIHSINPSSSGLLGGARLTIKGDGFTVEKPAAQVLVSGIKCEVDVVSLTELVCILGAAPADDAHTQTAGAAQPGVRGIHRQIWYGGSALFNVKGSPTPVNDSLLPPANVNDIILDLFEAPRDQQTEPLARFHGFFRPPVSSNYTLISAADDQSAVWVAERPSNTSVAGMEKVISTDYWLNERDFSWMFQRKEVRHWRDPRNRVRDENQRKSRKMDFNKDKAYYIDAAYKSWGGGEHFALAAVMHTTDLNEKDKPDAIDEKQHISVQVDTRLAVYNLTLRGGGGGRATGAFRLRLGGKESRAIPADASRDVMISALRELFSNCAVSLNSVDQAVNQEQDSGGSSSDCTLGRGWEYRGLKATTEDGEACLDWDSVIDPDQNNQNFVYDPWLVLSAGLDKNYCRAPIWWESGPGCFYLHDNGRALYKSCGIPKCGAGADDAAESEDRQPFPMVMTFEGLTDIEGPPIWGTYQGGIAEIDGVRPYVERGDAFCGSKSLKMPNTFGE